MPLKKYLLLVQRRNPSGATYVARKTVYAASKKAAAEEFSRVLGVTVSASKVIDVEKAIAENQARIAAASKAEEESTVELSDDIKESIPEEDKPAE